MTTPNHAIQSGIISYLIYPHWEFVLIAIILGIMPDIGRLFQKNKNNWNEFYNPAHDFIHHKWLLLIPFWNIHILFDYPMHDHIKGGWKWWGIYLEIFLWITYFIIIYFWIIK